METIDNYLYFLQEGVLDKVMCKKARYGIKLNRKNYLDPAKEGLKNCSQYKKSNPARYEGCRNYYQKVIDTTQRAIDRGKVGVKKYCGEGVSEAGFEGKPEGWTDKSIKKYTKTFSSKMKGTATSKDFFRKCVKKMEGKVDNPEGFCAALKDEAHGSTYWRGKGKKPAEVKQDVARHKNV